MINITDLKTEQQLPPLLRLGFRPFFLFGAFFAFLAIAIWMLSLFAVISFTPLNGAFWWHSHEMLFGFAPAIIAGFLLTAVQNWTGVASVKGKKLLFLVLLWLSARLLMAANLGLPVWAVMAIDLAFLPMVGIFLAIPLIKVGQQRNMVFLPIIFLMTLANLISYLPYLSQNNAISSTWSTQAFHAMVMLITLLVALLGGRVIPMFTANGTQTQKVLPIEWLEKSAMLSLLLIFAFFLSRLSEYRTVLGVLCVVSAVLHAYRIIRWRFWVTFKIPLVWVLHFTMLFIPIGLLMMALHFFGLALSLSTALHSLTVGVIGGMILAMMSRVSLGHTGRPLKTTALVNLAFYAIIITALLRSVAVAILPAYTIQLWLASGILWCLAFACFVWVYLPILSAPRADGRPG